MRSQWNFVFLKAYCHNPLEWRHNGLDSVSNHQPHDCLLNRLFRRRWGKHQRSASLAFVRGIHRGPVYSPQKWPVTRKMFPFHDVIMLLNHGCFLMLSTGVQTHFLALNPYLSFLASPPWWILIPTLVPYSNTVVIWLARCSVPIYTHARQLCKWDIIAIPDTLVTTDYNQFVKTGINKHDVTSLIV